MMACPPSPHLRLMTLRYPFWRTQSAEMSCLKIDRHDVEMKQAHIERCSKEGSLRILLHSVSSRQLPNYKRDLIGLFYHFLHLSSLQMKCRGSHCVMFTQVLCVSMMPRFALLQSASRVGNIDTLVLLPPGAYEQEGSGLQRRTAAV